MRVLAILAAFVAGASAFGGSMTMRIGVKDGSRRSKILDGVQSARTKEDLSSFLSSPGTESTVMKMNWKPAGRVIRKVRDACVEFDVELPGYMTSGGTQSTGMPQGFKNPKRGAC